MSGEVVSTGPKPGPEKIPARTEVQVRRGSGDALRQGVFEELRRIFKQYNRDVFYKLFSTLQQIFVRLKDKFLKE